MMRPTSRNLFHEFSISRFYFILVLSIVYFLTQMVTAHVSHSLILQLDAYHMLYNIFSLITCITTIKLCNKGPSVQNTFGWTRIDVCGAVGNLCFLSALCFSVVTDCIQTILHVSHHETMHFPVFVGSVGVIGVIVNFITLRVLGGYTFHQTSFLKTKISLEEATNGKKSLNYYIKHHLRIRHMQNFHQTLRDFFGCFLVIITSICVHFWSGTIIDLIDPFVTIFGVVILVCSSYDYAKKACHILLLTIPDHIDVDSLTAELQKRFPQIINIHEFHAWELTPDHTIASAHIVLRNLSQYIHLQNEIKAFFEEKSIHSVSLQPEFEEEASIKKLECFLPCGKGDCCEMQCCYNALKADEDSVSTLPGTSNKENNRIKKDIEDGEASVESENKEKKIYTSSGITPEHSGDELQHEAELEPMLP